MNVPCFSLRRFDLLVLLWVLHASPAIAQADFWQQTSGPYGGIIEALAFNSDGHLFAATLGGGVFRSTDNGESWIATNNGITNHVIDELTLNADGHLFAGKRDDGVFRSTDNGESWSPLNNGLTNTSVVAMTVTPDGYLFAGTGGGVFRSTDNGESWSPLNNGLTNTSVGVLTVTADGYLFAGTSGSGVFRSTLTTTSVEALASDFPPAFSLEQNYPNSFSHSTTIQFALTRPGPVRLQVFDLLGREVATLVEGRSRWAPFRLFSRQTGCPAGYTSIVWRRGDGCRRRR